MADIGDGLATGTDLVAAAKSAVGQALDERLGGRPPDLLCVFVYGRNPETIADAGVTAVKIADAGTAIGCRRESRGHRRLRSRSGLDVYIESPNDLGGFVRHADIVRAAPVYLKFGLANTPAIYPSGTHLDPVTIPWAGNGSSGRRSGSNGSTATCPAR